MASILTNVSAMVALQSLNKTNKELDVVQNRVSTGLKVASAKDNAAIYNIAQQQRAEHSAYDAVTDSLNRATSAADVALAAGDQISDLFTKMREAAVAASDPSISDATRSTYNTQFVAYRDQVASIIGNATFDGTNLIDGHDTGIDFLANTDGSQTINMPIIDLRLTTGAGGTVASPAADVYVGTTDTIDTAANATAVNDRIVASLDYVNAQIARIGAASTRIENHLSFVSKLQDSITTGIGNLVDSDTAADAAKLQAIQVKQELSTQALSIANQSPQALLKLFQ
jgi:flagellin